jgi:hypothetical protein
MENRGEKRRCVVVSRCAGCLPRIIVVDGGVRYRLSVVLRQRRDCLRANSDESTTSDIEWEWMELAVEIAVLFDGCTNVVVNHSV